MSVLKITSISNRLPTHAVRFTNDLGATITVEPNEELIELTGFTMNIVDSLSSLSEDDVISYSVGDSSNFIGVFGIGFIRSDLGNVNPQGLISSLKTTTASFDPLSNDVLISIPIAKAGDKIKFNVIEQNGNKTWIVGTIDEIGDQ